ncbi:MAG: Crp/Fnr family transcriptional regulator, partial [Gammaproteobacteria bacterium]
MLETSAQQNEKSDWIELKNSGINPAIFQKDNTADKLLEKFTHPKQLFLKPQDVIYHEGADADAVYVISSGLVKLLRYLPNGRARIVRLHGPRHIVGLSGLIQPEYEHTAIATNDAEIIKVPISFIKEIRNTNPEFYLELAEQWYHYLREADLWITQFSTGSIRARVARLIIFLFFLEMEANPGYVKLLPGEDMASILGVTPESVSRVMAEFKRKHIMEPVSVRN